MKTNCAIYARVSSERQRDNFSVDAQVDRVKDYCHQHGNEAVAVFTDVASGKNLARPGMQDLLVFLAGKQVVQLVVWRYNRISRNLPDLLRVVERCQALGIEVVSVSEPVTGGTATQKLQITMYGILAQLERSLIRDNQGIAYQQKQTEGKAISSSMALGYRWDARTQAPVVDAETAPIVRYLFDAYMHGHGYRRLSKQVKRRFGRQIPPASVRVILTNRRYTGVVKNKFGEVRGIYPQLVTAVEYEAVQRIRQRRTKPRAPRPHLLKGKLVCPRCGRHLATAMTGEHAYYECTCQVPGFRVRRETVESELWQLVRKVRLPSVTASPTTTPQAEGLVRQRIITRYENGKIDLETLRAELSSWAHEEETKKRLAQQQVSDVPAVPTTAEAFFKLVDRVTFHSDGEIKGVFMKWAVTTNSIEEG